MSKKYAIIITLVTLAFFCVFFFWPVAGVLERAFFTESGEFTIGSTLSVLSNPIYLEGLSNAFLLGVASTLVTFLVALPLAVMSHRWVFPGKRWLTLMVLAPLVLPPFVGAVGVRHILGTEGSLNALLSTIGLVSGDNPVDWLGASKFWGIVLMNALHLYPILYMNILSSLSSLDPRMEQAAQNLGASPWTRFKKITLPLCMPGVFAGAAIVFIWSFTELGVPLVFDYTRVTPVQIYDGIKDLQGNPIPYVLVAVMLLVSVLIYFSSRVILGRSQLGHSSKTKSQSMARPLPLVHGAMVSVAFLGVFIVATIPHFGVFFLSVSEDWYGTVLPSGFTLAHYGEGLGHSQVVSSIRNSLVYALGATFLDVLLGVGIAWVIVRSTIWGRRILDAMMMLPLAVPGIVLAFGFLSLTASSGFFGFLVPASGNPAMILILAYAIRRLPFVVRAVVGGLEQSNIELEEAALSLGVTPSRSFLKISIPLIGSSLLAGAVLSFAFAMLEVSDSLMLAQQSEHFPITKAIYSLLSTLGNGHELASALGVWAMLFLALAISGGLLVVGKKGGNLFRF
ncbi:ABC transporter permease [Rubritalea marina]|uniref:ABC transporter permease n=1 Tax=Rubritalea marina TaxID=361055 RepID=UPI000368EB7B|nr:iron ABC transporter permease [Rubritalea marina]